MAFMVLLIREYREMLKSVFETIALKLSYFTFHSSIENINQCYGFRSDILASRNNNRFERLYWITCLQITNKTWHLWTVHKHKVLMWNLAPWTPKNCISFYTVKVKRINPTQMRKCSQIYMHREPLKVPGVQRTLSSLALYFLCSWLFRNIPRQFNIITDYSLPHFYLSNTLYHEITKALIIALKRKNHSPTTSKAFE